MLVGDMVTRSEAATEALGRRLGAALPEPSVWVLEGDLGAGKTVLARGILRGLGVSGQVRSPTFTLAIPYDGRLPVVHLDLYRLDDRAAIESLGWDDWIDGRQVLLIEWGERALEEIGDSYAHVTMMHLGDDERRVRLELAGDCRVSCGAALQEAWTNDLAASDASS